ncbi:hypothetical protein E2562_031876 [Oryza meyeriana var. granulata]|uniref:DUF834 domain-containing protein n=1 Tax=Oryza meyeriana var. granulata TaxID=110450 RepID=A0A6G1F041_9ORYZ|nr:hypothetical protein E2562_031876 [Oryza meyeriana var. granulata]
MEEMATTQPSSSAHPRAPPGRDGGDGHRLAELLDPSTRAAGREESKLDLRRRGYRGGSGGSEVGELTVMRMRRRKRRREIWVLI